MTEQLDLYGAARLAPPPVAGKMISTYPCPGCGGEVCDECDERAS